MNEAIAMTLFQRQREKEFIKPLFAVADPEKAGSLAKKYQAMVYPEFKYDDLKYMRDAQKYFKKLRILNLKAKIIH